MQVSMDAVARADKIADLIEKRLGVGGKGLERKLQRAGRDLPGWVRREAAKLAQAAQFAGNPKMMKRINPAEVEAAYRKCEAWLVSVEPGERRKDKLLSFLAVNAFNLGLLAALLIVLLIWRGYL